MLNQLIGLGYRNQMQNDDARYYAQSALRCSSTTPPLEKLKLRKFEAEARLKSAQDDLKNIEEAIRILEDNPATTKVLTALAKAGIS